MSLSFSSRQRWPIPVRLQIRQAALRPLLFRQRNRWVRGSNYLVRKYARQVLHASPRRIALELLYALSLYYIFFFAVITSDLLFFLSTSGVIRITVPGPYALV